MELHWFVWVKSGQSNRGSAVDEKEGDDMDTLYQEDENICKMIVFPAEGDHRLFLKFIDKATWMIQKR